MSRRHIILFSILLAVSILFFSLREKHKLALSAELSSLILFPFHTVNDILEYLTISSTRITRLEHEILSLQLENANLRTALVLDTTQHTENPYTLLKAHIVGRDPSNINGYLYIDKGSARSLVINQPVISPNGLVGKIIHVGTHNSIIETIENQGFTVSAVDVNSGIHGVVKNNRALLFDYIRIGDSISIGDSIYTSGMSEQFPAGILVGVVETIAEPKDMFFKPVYITPSVHVNQLVYTYILIEEHSNEDEEIMEKIPNAPNQ